MNIMKRKKSRRKPKKKHIKSIIAIVVGLLALTATILLYYINKNIKPIVENMAQMRAKQIAIKAINEAVYEEITKKFSKNDFISKMTDKNNKVTNVDPNIVNINRLSTKTQLLVQKKIDKVGIQTIQVPVGNLINNQLISSIGPKISISMVTIGNAKVNYYTEFKSDGINQTKYKIYIVIKVIVQEYISIAKVNVEVNETVPVAEAIIVGPIPTTYVEVPTANDAGNYISGGISNTPAADN
jgi:sporulation protein YunB